MISVAGTLASASGQALSGEVFVATRGTVARATSAAQYGRIRCGNTVLGLLAEADAGAMAGTPAVAIPGDVGEAVAEGHDGRVAVNVVGLPGQAAARANRGTAHTWIVR